MNHRIYTLKIGDIVHWNVKANMQHWRLLDSKGTDIKSGIVKNSELLIVYERAA